MSLLCWQLNICFPCAGVAFSRDLRVNFVRHFYPPSLSPPIFYYPHEALRSLLFKCVCISLYVFRKTLSVSRWSEVWSCSHEFRPLFSSFCKLCVTNPKIWVCGVMLWLIALSMSSISNFFLNMCLCVLEQRDKEALQTFQTQNIRNFSRHSFKVTETKMWVWLQWNLFCQSSMNENNVRVLFILEFCDYCLLSIYVFICINVFLYCFVYIICKQVLSDSGLMKPTVSQLI